MPSLRSHLFLRFLALSLLTLSAACDDGSGGAPVPTPTATSTATATSTSTPSPTFTNTSTPTATATNSPRPIASPAIVAPRSEALTLTTAVAIEASVESSFAGTIEVTIDGQPVNATREGSAVRAVLANVTPGRHAVNIRLQADGQTASANSTFEAIALDRPDECEVLNDASCLLPYPSSHFEEPADTPTGVRLKFPADGMPKQKDRRLPVEPYLALDGYSPTAGITMHFPGGVDPVRSQASRLLEETRTHDLTSLDPNSPTVLLDLDTGERILHFLEVDVRAARDNQIEREVTLLRPSVSLTPGHRYAVAMRNLVSRAGTPVVAEPAFAALRDRRPTEIAGIENRRAKAEVLFDRLAAAGVARNDLVLAFDFTVASDESLTSEMIGMRDETFAWLAERSATQTFQVTKVVESDCSSPSTRIWRRIEGTYDVPLYLKLDPLKFPTNAVTFHVDESGKPAANGVTQPPFTIAIPCTVLQPEAPVPHPIVLGHGLFGDGRGFVRELAETDAVEEFNYIAGATDWTGLASLDAGGGNNLPSSFVGRVALDQPRNFPALPDRMRQGQLNTLVLARMMKTGHFNLDPAFRKPNGEGALPGPDVEQFYFGASLGGIMGLMFAALSPDVINVHVDVPAINFGFILPRSVAFLPFETAIKLTGVTDPIESALLLSLTHELWVRGESAGYATHVTRDPLAGTNVKNVLVTAALHDQLVSNHATEIAARTLGIPSLSGSILPNRPAIPDVDGPVSSAVIYYDAASFDPNDPREQPFIPPIENIQPVANRCDPHGRQAFIPAAVDQLIEFLQPGGQAVNFCNGLCDAAEEYELPFGGRRPCNP